MRFGRAEARPAIFPAAEGGRRKPARSFPRSRRTEAAVAAEYPRVLRAPCGNAMAPPAARYFARSASFRSWRLKPHHGWGQNPFSCWETQLKSTSGSSPVAMSPQ